MAARLAAQRYRHGLCQAAPRHGSAIFWEGGRPIKTAIRDILETALLTLVIFLGVRLGVQNFRVEGQSREPSLHSNQYLLENKGSCVVGQRRRGNSGRFPMP